MSGRMRLLTSKDHGNRRTIIEDNNDDEGNSIVHEFQECQPIQDAAKIMRDDIAPAKEWRHVAFIPTFVYNQAAREGWLNDEKAWKKWANDPDNAAFRTWRGHL
jgi:hypothetical protein